MAKTLKPDGESATAKHNVAGLHKVMQQEAAKFFQIKAQRAALNDEAAESRKRLRDHGIQTKVFEHHLRLRELEAEAQQEWIEQQALCMEALPIGTQLDLLETVGEEQPAEVAAARAAARAEGEKAAAEGQASTDNPYKTTDHLHGDWSVGWMAATRRRAEEMRPKNAPEPAKKRARAKRARKKTPALAAVADSGLTPESQAQRDGKAAGQAGQPADSNPHEAGGKLYEFWAAAHKRHFKPPRNGAARPPAPTNPEPAPIVA